MASERSSSMLVEVIYAQPQAVWRREVTLPPGATAMQAVQASGFFEDHPQFGEKAPPVGVYGRLCTAHQVLRAGDRVEIYRPLVFDPMESRRRRQRHRQRRLEQQQGTGTLSGT